MSDWLLRIPVNPVCSLSSLPTQTSLRTIRCKVGRRVAQRCVYALPAVRLRWTQNCVYALPAVTAVDAITRGRQRRDALWTVALCHTAGRGLFVVPQQPRVFCRRRCYPLLNRGAGVRLLLFFSLFSSSASPLYQGARLRPRLPSTDSTAPRIILARSILSRCLWELFIKFTVAPRHLVLFSFLTHRICGGGRG